MADKGNYFRMTRAAGPWNQGQLVAESDLNAHPFAEKFRKSGAAVAASAEEPARSSEQQAELNRIEADIAELNARREALLAESSGVAPAQATVIDFDAAPEDKAEARAAGVEAIQPMSTGAVNVGVVVPDPEVKRGPGRPSKNG